MLEALFVAGGLGFLLGLRYRVLAAVVASAAIAVASPAVAYTAGAPVWTIVLAPLTAVVALQAGYVAGVISEHVLFTRSAKLRDRSAGQSGAGGALDPCRTKIVRPGALGCPESIARS
jgi:hypothetical protein